MTPIAMLRCVMRLRAAPLGEKRNSAAAASTRSRVSSSTGALALSTRETVATETPARPATSLIVMLIDGLTRRADRPASAVRHQRVTVRRRSPRRENVYIGSGGVKGPPSSTLVGAASGTKVQPIRAPELGAVLARWARSLTVL